MGIPWYTNPLRFLRPSKILGAAKNKTSQVRINHHFPWVFYGFPLFSMGFPWFSIVFHGFPWVFLGSPSGYPAFSMVFPSSGSLSSAPPVIPRGLGPRRPARRVSASPGVGSSLSAVDPPFGPGDRHPLGQVKL